MGKVVKSSLLGALCAAIAATALTASASAGPINMVSPRGIEAPSLTDHVYYRRYYRRGYGGYYRRGYNPGAAAAAAAAVGVSGPPQLAPPTHSRIITVIPPMDIPLTVILTAMAGEPR